MFNIGRPLGWSTIGVAALLVGIGFPLVTGSDHGTDRSTADNVAAGPVASVLDSHRWDRAVGGDSVADSAGDTVTVIGPMTAIDIFDGLRVVFGGPGARPPDRFGDDAELDRLWSGCEGGEGTACDQLFDVAPVGSEYEEFGLTCGRRLGVLDCRIELGGAGDGVDP